MPDPIEMTELKCPSCNYRFNRFYTYQHVSLHGGDGGAECPLCQAKLAIQEIVVRTWEVTVCEEAA